MIKSIEIELRIYLQLTSCLYAAKFPCEEISKMSLIKDKETKL
jgi:hypothetical protein